MSGSGITIKINDAQAKHFLKDLVNKSKNAKAVMKIAGHVIQESVVDNFDDGGRPTKWKANADATLKQKRGNKPLTDRGMNGGLKGSITHYATDKSVAVGTNKIYGAIHQLGGQAGRNKSVTITARPFLLVQDEDWDDIKDAVLRFLKE